jgi:hypothetical protein
MAANRKYKSSVFALLFNNPAALRELYGALEGIELSPDTPVEIKTLESPLFMILLNDLAFLIGGRLIVLVEHQSTINPNMAFRLFLYIGEVYERLLAGEEKQKELLGRKLFRVPRPEFIVLYNGAEPYPDTAVLRLSDSFMDASAFGAPPESPPLELTVKVYNINGGRNPEIAARSRTLREYGVFVAKAREFGAEGGTGKGRSARARKKALERALEKTITWCVAHDILKDFLILHGTEVLKMLLKELTIDDVIAVRERDSREEGLERGREEKEAESVRNLLEFGMTPEQISRAIKLSPETVARYMAE